MALSYLESWFELLASGLREDGEQLEAEHTVHTLATLHLYLHKYQSNTSSQKNIILPKSISIIIYFYRNETFDI